MQAATAAVGADADWDRWSAWLGNEPKAGTIYGDLLYLRAARRIWEGFQSIVSVAPEDARKYGSFHTFFDQAYIRSQGMGVRRQADIRDDVVSLGRLLDRVSKAAGVVTRKRYLARLHPTDRGMGDEFFDNLCGPGARALDPAIPLEHLTRVRDETARVRTWITKEFAHYDEDTGKFSEGLLYKDVHHGIDLLFVTMNFYQQLLNGTTVAPTVEMAPWEAVFRVPWLEDDAAWHHVARLQQQNEDRRIRELK
jgi:hypothetical protein